MLCKSVKLLHLPLNCPVLVCLLGLHPITLLPLRWRVIIYNQPKTLLLEVVLPDFDLNSLSDLRIGANEYLPSAISFNLVF